MTTVSNTDSQRKHWLRLWHDMPTDPKFRVIARRSGRPLTEVLSVFVLMLTNASANATERGTLNGWNDEDIAAALDMEPEHVTAICDAMQGKTLDGDRLQGWEKRQPKREDGSSERAKAWRERNRTQPNAPRTLRREEIREDIEVSVNPLLSPLAKPKSEPKTDSKRGARLPADWALPDEWRSWAQINFAPDDAAITLEAERFRDFWIAKPGQAGCKLDWQATWRNWCRNSKAPATRVNRPPMENWQDRKAHNASVIYNLAMGGSGNA